MLSPADFKPVSLSDRDLFFDLYQSYPQVHSDNTFTNMIQTLHALEDLPRRMVIVGGGVVAAEFAHIFRAFGSEVEIVARH
ncbi:MAG: NAD-binding protein, partial [Methanothrix sp.]|nr:NAD-binding protein [Methanothrix sp.]